VLTRRRQRPKDHQRPAGTGRRPSTGDEQLESRALGKPKETVETQTVKSEADEALDNMSTEELEALVQRGMHLRAIEDEATTPNETVGAGD
jgi:hypothetical protein